MGQKQDGMKDDNAEAKEVVVEFVVFDVLFANLTRSRYLKVFLSG